MQPNPKIQNCLQACADWGLIPTEFKQCMTWEEQVLWLFKFLNNTVIPAVNTDIQNVETLATDFAALSSHVDNYFDNLDVQEEINNKLDEMAEDGSLGELMSRFITPAFDAYKEQINGEIDDINSNFSQLQAFVSASVSSSPIPVDSTDDMTDTSKVYLLTTDGYWYYYNGTIWTRGGIYQSTGIADGAISPVKTTFSKRSNNLIDIKNASIINGVLETNGTITVTDTNKPYTVYVPITGGKSYTFIRKSSTVPRMVVAFSADVPANGGYITQRTDAGSGVLSKTIKAPASANYALLNFARTNQIPAGYTVNDLLEMCCIKEGTDTTFSYSYILSLTNEDYNTESITPDKTTFNKQSSNLFNPNGSDDEGMYPDTGLLYTSNAGRCCWIEVDGNTSYVVRKMQSSRFSVMFTKVLPANEVAYTGRITKDTGTQIKCRSAIDDKYLVVYYYRGASDTGLTAKEIRDTIVICEGTEDIQSYIPYGKILKVDSASIDDGAVNSNKLSPEVKNSLNKIGRLQSRSGIFGVQFDLTSNSTKGVRIGNAEGLYNDYVIGNDYQLNNGVNDFDNIYPWCDMRRCNVKFVDGVKVVTYDDSDDFALDGSNGEVMVEIPKFYSYRKRIGNIETWAISGEPKAEFNVEPAFVVNGEEKDYIYVSCYEASELHNNAFSSTGTTPKTNTKIADFITDFSAKNLQSYDITIFQMMQKLVTIEFGDRNIQNYMGGVTYLPYFYRGDQVNVITAVGTNTVTVKNNDGGGRKSALWVGERIKFITSDMSERLETYARLITNISVDGTDTTITYSGSDLSGVLSVGDGMGGAPQVNGLTDDLPYHTGRTTHASGNAYESFVNPMRYRWIENLYGNMWEQIAGIRVMNLDYYISTEPNYYEPVSSTSEYYKVGYKAPLQNQLGEGGAGYIVEEGYDDNNHTLNLPTLCGISNGGGADKYYADAFYSKNETPTTQYASCVGGGWDHYQMAGVFCLRSWQGIDSIHGLEGNRAIYR